MIVKRGKDIHWICFIAGKYSVWYNHGSLTGEIAVGEYDYHTAALPVIVYNIANDDSIASVTAVVWHNEDQSDLQWVELPQNEDGTYSTNVNIANFNFVLGEYHIHVYAVNTDGQQYFLGEGMGSVQ